MEEITIYDHYVAIDWSIRNMAIARMTPKSNKITVIDVPSDVVELKVYLQNLVGSKVLAIEECTASQWLFAELRDCVDELIICDPVRNRLLSEGAKTDKIDASKLVQLLRSGLMKAVYHSSERFLYLRKLVSGYEDLVKSGVRLKNQRSSLLQSCGKKGREKDGIEMDRPEEQFVLEGLNRQISAYKEEKKNYEKEFERLHKKYDEIRNLASLPGIAMINAVKIVARVVTPHRFADKGHYLSYLGLVKLDKISGGRSYGYRNPRYCRQLKAVYKGATVAALGHNNVINSYYEYLLREKNYPEHMARHKACRRLAILSFGILKSRKAYQPPCRPLNEATVSGLPEP